MAKIPQYEQQQLASSVVGTPGVDSSLSDALTGVAQAAQGVESAAARQAQYDAVLAARAQRQQAALAAAQKKRLDGVEVSKRNMDWADEDSKDIAQLKEDYAGDPQSAPDEYRKSAEQRLQTFLDGTPDPAIRASVEKAARNGIASNIRTMQSWALTERTKNVQNDVAYTITGYVNKVNSLEPGDIKGLQQINAQVDALKDDAHFAFGDSKGDAVLLKAKEDIAKNYVNSLMLKPENAGMVEPTLNSGAFDAVLNADEKNTLRLRAAAIKRSQEVKVKQDNQLQGLSQQIGITGETAVLDDNDLQGAIAAQQKFEKQLEAELSKPATEQHLGTVSALSAGISKTNTIQKNIAKQQSEAGKKALAARTAKYKQIYDSAAGVNTRQQLHSLQSWTETRKFPDKQSHIDAWNHFVLTVNRAAASHAITPSEQVTLLNKATDEVDKLTYPKKRTMREAGPLAATEAELRLHSKKVLGMQPAANGMTEKQTRVKLMDAYEAVFSGMIGKYKKLNGGAEPSPALLKKYDATARVYASGSIFHE